MCVCVCVSVHGNETGHGAGKQKRRDVEENHWEPRRFGATLNHPSDL